MKHTLRLGLRAGVLALATATVLTGVTGAQSPNPMDVNVEFLVPQVIDVRPHDTGAWIEGFVFVEGKLYESTGVKEQSSVREIDPETGEILRQIDLAPTSYGEGLARVDDRLIQLTWKENTAFVYDLATLEQVGTFSYEGEGWGLCADDQYIYMTNGTPFILVRDRETFDLLFSLAVTLRGQVISQYVDANNRALGELNELECVGDYLYSNIWQTQVILKINKHNGVVEALVDASSLGDDKQPGEEYELAYLNGIAYLPDSDTFLVTGKYWPRMYEVTFVPKE